jgi:superfamily II DNA or RNA helicase
MRLEEILPGSRVRGFVIGGGPVEIIASSPIGTRAVSVTYRTAEGTVDEVMVHRDQEHLYTVERQSSSWDFSGDAALFRLTAEARRIRLAHLFDPMLAVNLSAVRPLPHQIDAVYCHMLPRVPMRFALCDDPGAGKTIMAGLYVKELLLRGDLHRCLIVAPGALATQWQDELIEKFDLHFDIVTREAADASYTGNPFTTERQLLIVRLDQLARNSLMLDRACQVDWDVVICDEAHRMAAHMASGGDVHYTKRYRVGQRLGASCRNFLLLTATPHAGKDDDFQLWMALLDSDRFEGRQREGSRAVDVTDVMRRMVKETLLTFEGRRLFPERRAYTVEYELSPPEQALYEAVTEYVREEMGRADRVADESGDVRRKTSIGFALTSLQRRLASSPEAIRVSISRRLRRLRVRADELRLSGRNTPVDSLIAQAERILDAALDDEGAGLDELTVEDEEQLEELVDTSSAASTLAELDYEIQTLERLEQLAQRVRDAGVDRKWLEVSSIVRDNPLMRSEDGQRRKLIVFTEHKDTLHYLVERLRTLIGRDAAVVFIHGGTVREERRGIQERFTNDPDIEVLVATDAAGEGINLQRAHLMVNYDLPWNPNRIEQRFGRIHRIGQESVCHLWNLVAAQTREGAVFLTLLNKLEEQRAALGDQVFDVLGQAFQGTPLRDLLLEAIRYGEQPSSRARITEIIDGEVGARLAELVQNNALDASVMDLATVEAMRLQMEEAEARRLQPHYIKSFWLEAFEHVGGRAAAAEPGRYEVTRVPQELRQRDRATGGGAPLLHNYERICFDASDVRPSGLSPAAMIRPGHPLLDTVVDSILERYEPYLLRGAVLIDDHDLGTEPRVLAGFEHRIVNGLTSATGQRRTVSRRFQFVTVDSSGVVLASGPAPYLDLRPPTPKEAEVLSEVETDAFHNREAVLAAARVVVSEELSAVHLNEIRLRTTIRVEKMKEQVSSRLAQESAYWDHRARQLQLEAEAGKQPKANPIQARQRSDDLLFRRERRLAELAAEATLASLLPTAAAVALIVPRGLLDQVQGAASIDVVNRARERAAVERRAVEAVIAAEKLLGRRCEEQAHNNPGFDIKSFTEDGHLLLIEVKGRIEGADTVTVTRNEILTGLNTPRFVLALVQVSSQGSERDVVRYLRHPFTGNEATYFDMTSVNFTWDRLWDKSTDPN